MKIFFKRATAIFLAVIMIIGCSVAGFAGVQPEATFSITKTSETPENVVLSFNLVSGSFSSIDFTTTIAGENLVCDSIVLSDEFTAWDSQSGFEFTPNTSDGNVTLSGSIVCDSVMPLVVATYSKTNGKGGIVKSDFSAAVNSCSTIVETQSTPVSASITVEIAETHSHITPEAYTVIKKASCKEAGLQVKACPECGIILDKQTIDKQEHKKVSLHQDATCTEDGYTVKVCTVCFEEFDKVVIPAKNHNWSKWTTIQQATISKPGIRERYCLNNPSHVQREEIPQIYVEPTSIVILAGKTTSLKYGTSMQIFANILPAEASYMNTIEWTSSNPKVVTVDETGNLTAVGYGSATITASTKDGKLKDSVKIRVRFSLWQVIVNFIRDLLGNL